MRARRFSKTRWPREALGGLAACERWFRRGLVYAHRRELWKTVLRTTRLVEWRDRPDTETPDCATEDPQTQAGETPEPAARPTSSDGTRRPRLTREQVLARADKDWRTRAIGGRPGKRAARGWFDHIPPALRLASVRAMPRPCPEPDIVFEYHEPYDPYPKPRTWTDPNAIVPPRGRAGALPAVVVDPAELGWTPEITQDEMTGEVKKDEGEMEGETRPPALPRDGQALDVPSREHVSDIESEPPPGIAAD